MKFIMNEREYIEKILAGKGFGDNYSYTCMLAARYYRQEGCNDRELKVILERLLKERVPTVSKTSCRRWKKKALNGADKLKLCEIGSIAVSREEIERIRAVHSDKFKDCRIQKLAFTLLCFAKFGMAKGIRDGWVNIGIKHIFKAAYINGLNVETQWLFIHELYKSGYIDLNRRIESGSIKVLGIADGETGIEVSDINCAGLFWEKYCGRKFTECRRCQKMIRVTNGRNMYCADCASEINRERARERLKKLHILA